MNWRNRVVVITGASAGVGRALARDLARRGAALGLLARGVEGSMAHGMRPRPTARVS